MPTPRATLDLLLLGTLIVVGALAVRGWTRPPVQEAVRPTLPAPSAPAPAPVEHAVALLGHIDLKADGVGEPWTIDNGRLISPSAKAARIQLACTPPEEYDVRATVTRLQGGDALILGVLFQGRQLQIVLDGNEGKSSWMEVRDGGHGISRFGVTFFDGGVFVNDRKADLLVTVRSTRVTVTVDGFHVLDWVGPRDRLYVADGWDMPRRDLPFLGAWQSVFAIDSPRIVPIGGTVAFQR